MVEEWRPCPEFEKHYQVSNLGNVRRIKGGMGTRWGKALKPWAYNDGRKVVSLSIKCKITKRLVSRLVCMAFHGEPPSLRHQAAHWDGNPANNKASNLRWATQTENEADKIRHGRYNHSPSGSKHIYSKLHEIDIPTIRTLRKSGLSYAKIAAKYGVDWSCVRGIIKGRSWKHVKT